MDAIRKIEAADSEAMADAVMEHLGPLALTHGRISPIVAFELGWKARAQALASKEAELAAREAEIANQALNYVSLFGELQNAMAEIERVRSLTDAQIDDLWIRRDCIEAIQAGDICAQVRCVVRAALTQQPKE